MFNITYRSLSDCRRTEGSPAIDRHRPDKSEGDDAVVGRLVAERLRRLRQANGLSLRELGEAVGTSASFLSQLERGLTGASLATLMRIANCYGTSIAELFAGTEGLAGPVLRAADRPTLPIMNGQRKTLLSRRPLTHFECYISEFEPGGSTGDEAYTHGDSYEMLLVLGGRVRVDLDGESHDLAKGDSIEYATSVQHRVANFGEDRAEVLFVIAPPTSTKTYLDAFRAARGGGRSGDGE